jgi:hypothetical protein
MPFKHQCLLYVIRYMPDVVKGEFVNVGVVLVDQASSWCDFKLTNDLRRLRCLDPDFDPELLTYLERDMRGRLSAPGALAQFLQNGTDWPSQLLQASLAAGVETNDMQAELTHQSEMYLKTTPRPTARDASVSEGKRLTRAIHDAFGSDHLGRFFRWDIPVADYVPDDPLVIQCGYQINGVFKMFHAVPLQKNTDAAKALAFSYPLFSQAFADKEKLKTQLTAIIDEYPRESTPNVNFAHRAFLGCGIQTYTVAHLQSLADAARRDLRV